MAVLGLIIALATGAFIASAVLNASDPATLNVLGTTNTMSVGRWVALGAIAGLLFALGLVMLFGGLGRANRRRRETKQVVVTSRTEAEELRIENERLARELEERQAQASGPAVVEHRVVDDQGVVRPVQDSAAFVKGQDVNAEGYLPRHGDDTYNAPVAYPAEPTVARTDVETGSESGRNLR
jgi:hypothetical protein